MDIKMIDEIVLSYLSRNQGKGFTYRELDAALTANRKEKKALDQCLIRLVDDGKISKDRKHYRLLETQKASRRSKTQSSKTANSPALFEGIFDATSLARDRSFAFIRTLEMDYYVDAENTLNAFHGDRVAFEVIGKGRNTDAVVRKVLQRANTEIPGEIMRFQNRFIFIASNPKIHSWFEVNDLGGASEKQRVILSVTNWGLRQEGKLPRGRITEILGESGDPQVELLSVIRQYNLPLTFPEPVLDELLALQTDITEQDTQNRKDLRELLTFTIDPISAKDYDDAISISKHENGFKLWVHIADVAHYLKLQSATFQEAASRGNSFYFPKMVIPMIPEKLSNQVCSLRPHEDKLCITVESTFDSKAKVKQQRIYESLVRSDFRLSYNEIDQYFTGEKTELSPPLLESLDAARRLSALLSKQRKKAGYIYLDLPEVEYEYDEDGFLVELGLSSETESHKLIENFMLVANEYVAKALSQKTKTAIYRIHEDPDQYKLDRLYELLSFYGVPFQKGGDLNKSIQFILDNMPDSEYHKVFDRLVLRSMKKAKYSTRHIRHFGLALEDYTHFTSPIRRLCDLATHHLCKIHLLSSSHEKISDKSLHHWASVASEQELNADTAERDVERIFSRIYMKDRLNEAYTGIVISANKEGVIVRLNELPITAVMLKDQFGAGRWEFRAQELRHLNRQSGKSFELMDSLKIRIMEVSDDVYLELDSVPKNHIHHSRNLIAQPVKKSIDGKERRRKVDSRQKEKGRSK